MDAGPQDRSAQESVQALLTAWSQVADVDDLDVVLRRIVEAARDLVGADYGALGVVSPHGDGLDAFIHVGLDEETVRRIGHLPQGNGLLGALIADPRPIRLADLAEDPRAAGFPEAHPPMRGFLGVPVTVRDEVFGNLYLATREPGGFDATDEALVCALAASAAVCIDNARLRDAAVRRQRWLQASAHTSLEMLTGTTHSVLGTIGSNVKELADADVVTVVQPDPEHESLVVEVAVGVGDQELLASTYAMEHTLSAHVLETGRPVIADVSRDDRSAPGRVYLSGVVPVGPVMALPLVGAATVRGVLVVGRLRGRSRFTDDDLEMASSFANHASVTLELVEARRDQQRVLILEDRARIARDLHDHVIQQLFAAGMALQGVAVGVDATRSVLLGQITDQIDRAIRQIRSSIFQLTPQRFGGHLRAAVLDVVAEVTPVLEFAPEVRFSGPVDILTDPDLTADVAAVVREALTNVARHASAHHASVVVDGTTDVMRVCVTDDGIGTPDAGRRSGLDNIRRRAEQRGGSLTVEDARPGTRLTWTASLA